MGRVRDNERGEGVQRELSTGGVGQRERRGYEDGNGYGWGGSEIDREERVCR